MTSDYKYQFRKVKKVPFIMIEDEDKGGRSVTNDIHNVVLAIAKKEKVDPMKFTIIYKDSMGNWDMYHLKSRQILPLQEKHWLKAAVKIIGTQTT